MIKKVAVIVSEITSEIGQHHHMISMLPNVVKKEATGIRTKSCLETEIMKVNNPCPFAWKNELRTSMKQENR